MSKSTHIASCAILGPITGTRVGTRYFFRARDAVNGAAQPGFSWRNEECRLSANAETHRAESAGSTPPAEDGA